MIEALHHVQINPSLNCSRKWIAVISIACWDMVKSKGIVLARRQHIQVNKALPLPFIFSSLAFVSHGRMRYSMMRSKCSHQRMYIKKKSFYFPRFPLAPFSQGKEVYACTSYSLDALHAMQSVNEQRTAPSWYDQLHAYKIQERSKLMNGIATSSFASFRGQEGVCIFSLHNTE